MYLKIHTHIHTERESGLEVRNFYFSTWQTNAVEPLSSLHSGSRLAGPIVKPCLKNHYCQKNKRKSLLSSSLFNKEGGFILDYSRERQLFKNIHFSELEMVRGHRKVGSCLSEERPGQSVRLKCQAEKRKKRSCDILPTWPYSPTAF